MRITNELRQAIAENPLPLKVVDDQAQKAYYVVSAEDYRRLQLLVDAGPVDRSFYEATEVRLFDE
jgi:hypothetical protein